ncbi:MAG: WYL domain-containing protein [Treponema sp.]|nr:WYL domain-containing protein [Treponema sp.]
MHNTPPPLTAKKQVKVNNWRIVAIDEILQSGRPYTAKELSARIEDGSYSARTIQRDLEYMRDTLNAPIENDWRGYRYTEQNFFIKSIPLTEGEAFAVAALNPLLEQYRNTPLEKQLRSVFAKIASCLPQKITVDTSFLNPKITFIPDRTESINPKFFKTVFDALKACRALAFEYRPLQKTTFMQRTIEPYHVVCQRGNWYVIGKCRDKNDVRIFSLSRMKSLAMTKEKFSVPKSFKASDYFDAEMGIWLSDKIPIEAELLFDKEIGTYALNHIWHSEQTVQERPDGSVYVKFKTTQKREILRWILGQGHTVKVLGPADFAAEVQAELKKALEQYGKQGMN